MTTLTTAQTNALALPVAHTAFFLELQFRDGTVRICSYTQNFTWGGFTWIGLGAIGTISQIEESANSVPISMQFGLNIVQADILALMVGDAQNYRGHAAKLYFSPLDSSGNLIDTPVVCWRGYMDTVTIGVDGENGNALLKCENSSYSLKRRSLLRMNSAQQKQRCIKLGLTYQDTGFDLLNNLISTPQLWLSKKFQQQ